MPFPVRGSSGNSKPFACEYIGMLIKSSHWKCFDNSLQKILCEKYNNNKEKKHLHQRPRNNRRRRMNMLQRIVANAHV